MPNASPRRMAGSISPPSSKQDLIEALEKTLGCPMLSELDPGDFRHTAR